LCKQFLTLAAASFQKEESLSYHKLAYLKFRTISNSEKVLA